ncbi:uncharacterized protein EAE97_000645 [Botrytis byssoidea]|uniref:Uncharacterized protein n=1 Tax=Botrytis byssoidea TaxID=139641 RepID=A0A9P5IZ96_9HELO|nr:uncharacterized protein EAE97_000645 [Botrytis byssoidea]KAF7955386.1 hypothetical protein EAE97_000645 [Botrytis byssoidea]
MIGSEVPSSYAILPLHQKNLETSLTNSRKRRKNLLLLTVVFIIAVMILQRRYYYMRFSAAQHAINLISHTPKTSSSLEFSSSNINLEVENRRILDI